MSRASAPDSETTRHPKRRWVSLAVASVILLSLFLYGLGTLGPPAATGASSTAKTSFETDAPSLLASLASNAPPGYSQGTPKALNPNEQGLLSAGYSVFSSQGGALANVTILVFDSPASAQSYVDSVISNAKGLMGYSNANSTLTGYEGYGVCYGYAESDPGGGGSIANGVCTKGNVYIQVHVATVSSLPSAEGDMSGFIGAAYRGLS